MRRPTNRRLLDLAGVLLIASLVAACAPTEPAEGALRNSSGEAIYADGTYVVSYSHTGTDGWQPHLQLQVRAGFITQACYGAVNAEGTRIQDDEGYRERVRLNTGADLVSLTAQLESLLITAQQLRFELPVAGLDTVLTWTVSFVVLADAALNLARAGETTTAVIPAVGPYVGHDQPDELGWEARVVIAFAQAGLTAASFEEYRSESDGSVKVKATDPVYTEAYERVLQLTPAGVADQLSRQLVERGVTETDRRVSVDGLTGATGTANRFQILANKVVATRITVPLPHKLCSP